jgi:ankyrin repeat protein
MEMEKTLPLPVTATRPAVDRRASNPTTKKHDEKKTELHWAAMAGNHDQVASILEQDSQLARRHSILTISGGNMPLDINAKDELGRTALHWAVARKHVESVEVLLQHGKTLRNLQDKDGRTLLHEAAIKGFDDIVEMLLRKQDSQSHSVGTQSLEKNTADTAWLDFSDHRGRTALHWAAEYGHLPVVKRFIDYGASASNVDYIQGDTALHRAALRDNATIVAYLIGKKRELADAQNKLGDTPLHLAARCGNDAVVRTLLKESVDVTIENKINETALRVAAKNGREEVTWLLLQEPKLQSQYQSEALLLIQRCPSLHRKDELLLWAAEKGHEAVVKLLLEAKADVNSKDENSRTLLFLAAEGGHEAVVKLLVEKGADINTKDKDGLTPLSWAAGNGHEAIVQLLIDTGKADIESKDSYYGRTPLLWAARNGHEAVAKLLLEAKADVNSKDKASRTPLMWAAKGGDEAVVKLLLEAKADVNSKDNGSRTPLLLAAEGGHGAVVKLLQSTVPAP